MTRRRKDAPATGGSSVDAPPDATPEATPEADSTHVVALRPYSIGTAARLAGVAPDTLRMWERRYGFTDPTRTVGGHRLYSEEDVALVRAVKRLIDGGARVGSLADLDRQALMTLAADMPRASTAGGGRGAHAYVDAHEALVEEIVEAARTFDTARAAALLDRPRLLGEGREVVRLVYLPLLRRVGDLWHQGAVTVAVEHFVEKLVSARLHAVLAATPDGHSGRLALCACPPGERHEGGLFAAALELRLAGFAVTLLGADTPVTALVSAAKTMAPDLLVMAVTIRVTGTARRDLLEALEAAPLRDLPLVLGGAAAGDLARSLTRAQVLLLASIDAVGSSALRAAAR